MRVKRLVGYLQVQHRTFFCGNIDLLNASLSSRIESNNLPKGSHHVQTWSHQIIGYDTKSVNKSDFAC